MVIPSSLSIYPDVDLVYYGNQRKLEYDLELGPHADASQIKLAVQGAVRLIAQADGSLIVRTEAGDLAWEKPVAYQMKDGKQIEVNVAYRLGADADKGDNTPTVAFNLGSYDHTLALTIDPTLQYAAAIGPTEFGQYTAADNSGSAYVLSSTISPEYPTTSGSYMPTSTFTWDPPSLYTGPNHPLLAITKFSPDGSTLVYSTYLGGSQFVCGDGNAGPPSGNHAGAIAVDAAGNAIVSGQTDDTNFPVTANAIQKTDKNCSVAIDVTVSKLSADGMSSKLCGRAAESCSTRTRQNSERVGPQKSTGRRIHSDVFFGGVQKQDQVKVENTASGDEVLTSIARNPTFRGATTATEKSKTEGNRGNRSIP